MDKYKFYFNPATVDYYVDGFRNCEFGNGWAGTALEIYKFISDECDYDDESVICEHYTSIYSNKWKIK